MLTRPNDLSDAQVVAALAVGWDVRADEIEYAPVGFGSYHWRVVAGGEGWFVTADDLAIRSRERAEPLGRSQERLTAALTTARALRDDGLTFVVAPLRTAAGDIVQMLDDRFALALYPYVDGETHDWGPHPSAADRLAVLDIVSALHQASPDARAAPLVDDFTIPDRGSLEAALADLSAPWSTGPFAERARRLLDAKATAVKAMVDRYDSLIAAVAGQGERMVVTHGEPHRSNTITTANGVVLIDWDTTLIAPPERDLWSLADEDHAVLGEYAVRTGVTPNAAALELYRLWWEIADISLYIALFRQPHAETDDTRVAWNALAGYLR